MMESNLIVFVQCLILSFLFGVIATFLSDLRLEDVASLAKRWWKSWSKGAQSAGVQRPSASADASPWPEGPLVPCNRYWTMQILKNGCFRLVELENDEEIDYNPKAHWAEECNQSHGCTKFDEVEE